jgi:hypothetical protein
MSSGATAIHGTLCRWWRTSEQGKLRQVMCASADDRPALAGDVTFVLILRV